MLFCVELCFWLTGWQNSGPRTSWDELTKRCQNWYRLQYQISWNTITVENHSKSRVSVAGKQLQQKLEWIRKWSWISRPSGLRPTSPTIQPGTTDPSSYHSSIHLARNLSLRSLWQRRRTTKSWTLCRTQPSRTLRTPQPGFTMPGWLDGAEVLRPLCGSHQVIWLCLKQGSCILTIFALLGS